MKKNDNNINAFQWMHTIVLCSILFLGLNILKAQPTQVGDLITFPDGSQGIVCYIDNNNKKGWVVDLYDLAGTYKLYNSSNVPSAIPNQSYTYSHSVHNWDPTGKSNTLTLFQANNGYDYSPAAIAVDPESGWYIPDAEQMMMMLSMVSTLEKSFDKAGVGSITEILESGRLYWTSTKYSSNTFYNLGYLTYYVPIKTIVTSECTNEYYIRRVRDFDQMESAFVYWLDPEGKGTIQVGPDTTTTYDALVIYGKDTFDVQKTVVVHPAFHEEDTVTAIITDLSSTSGYYWLDSLYTESGTYTKIAYTKEGCDSINVLHLVLLDVDTTADTTCAGTPVDLTLPVTTRGEPLISGIPNIHIGDVLCTDGSVMRPNAYLSSSKAAMGVVFYVDLAEGIGRAIALSDVKSTLNSPRLSWASGNIIHSTPKTDVLEARFDMDGASNTEDILRTARIASGSENTATYAAAAHYCKYYNHNTYALGTDSLGWYLPAAGEWILIYGNRVELNNTLTKLSTKDTRNALLTNSSGYWTSTEYSSSEAWSLASGGNLNYNVSKSTTRFVRPVIQFPLP